VISRICGRDLRVGDSLAINGCCLTAVHVRRQTGVARLQFDLLKETWDRTNFPALREGSLVNLERSLQVSDRLGGHFVTGHIDGVGTIRRWERVGKDHVLDLAAPPEVMRYIVFKGSVAVDGISLTVAGVKRGAFRIWIIPHTFEVTALQERQVGDPVNLEADLIGKYVERFVATLPRSRARGAR
jgi:riboflavin synthase